MLGYLLWDPNRIMCYIPYLGIPITWYGCFFAFGFLLGFHVFVYQWVRFLCGVMPAQDRALPENMQFTWSRSEMRLLNYTQRFLGEKRRGILEHRFCLEKAYPKEFRSIWVEAREFCERLLLYVMVATVIGARLGHIVFYQDIVEYLRHPLDILKTWEGGLASHGGVFAILISLYLFSRKWAKTWSLGIIGLLDILCVPMMLGFSFIRVGNFFNQEILGQPTSFFLGVCFGHPMDGSSAVVRHPVQLYEAAFYFLCFWALLWLWRSQWARLRRGRMSGIAMSVGFLFRFCVEGLKSEQSILLADSYSFLLMGQYLSIPFIWLGLVLFFYADIKRLCRRPFRLRAYGRTRSRREEGE